LRQKKAQGWGTQLLGWIKGWATRHLTYAELTGKADARPF
jgi:hypothetical protein